MSLTNATPLEVAQSARLGSRQLAVLSTEERNAALVAIHDALAQGKEAVLAANAKDLESANKAAEGGTLSASLVKRLDLGKPGKYEDMLQGILDVKELEDPINKTTAKTLLDDDLTLSRITCPIGVLLIIFEARPEVIANISALAIKSGNAAILKGGRESSNSFAAIASIISKALESSSVPSSCLQLVQTHDVIADLLKLDTFIDLCIPRGGNKLVRYVKDNTTIPVLGHADGICCTYFCADYPVEKATKIILDAKTSYPAGCNSTEQLLVDTSALHHSPRRRPGPPPSRRFPPLRPTFSLGSPNLPRPALLDLTPGRRPYRLRHRIPRSRTRGKIRGFRIRSNHPHKHTLFPPHRRYPNPRFIDCANFPLRRRFLQRVLEHIHTHGRWPAIWLRHRSWD
jgi:hypothetical protein